jgi:hypothetical protein
MSEEVGFWGRWSDVHWRARAGAHLRAEFALGLAPGDAPEWRCRVGSVHGGELAGDCALYLWNGCSNDASARLSIGPPGSDSGLRPLDDAARSPGPGPACASRGAPTPLDTLQSAWGNEATTNWMKARRFRHPATVASRGVSLACRLPRSSVFFPLHAVGPLLQDCRRVPYCCGPVTTRQAHAVERRMPTARSCSAASPPSPPPRPPRPLCRRPGSAAAQPHGPPSSSGAAPPPPASPSPRPTRPWHLSR